MKILIFCMLHSVAFAGPISTSTPTKISVVSNELQNSALATLAKSLTPGQWAALSTKNINLVLGDTSGNTATGDILPYSEGMVWDSITHRIFYVGSDHNYAGAGYQSVRFVYYDESTNSWFNTNQPPQGPGIAHAYDHNTMDPISGDFYFANFNDSGAGKIRKYNTKNSGGWSDFATTSTPSLQAALTFNPDLNSLLYITTSEVLRFQNNIWTKLGSINGLGPYHIFAEYNPVHKVTLMGGGNGSSTLYKLSSAGVITKLNNAPVELSIPTIELTVDPVSGDYLLLKQSDKSFRSYNVTTDTWGVLPAPVSSIWNTMGQDVLHVTAVPVTSYGVILFISCDGATNCRVNVYKHK